MQISNIKINGYGKLENKEIELKKGINVVKGNNEAGKSTLLNFIFSMFYGASKNKNGKDISDFDKYKPWSEGEFSGKIKYNLDNQEEYEVFRDFKKKNPKVYDKNLEDISDKYNIDKTKGNQFFVEQTGIDEGLFLNTMSVCQTEVVLDSSKQNSLVQKITNVVSSGEDNVSYKKTMEKLNKKMLEEVGNSRTVGRPINLIDDEITSIERDIRDLEYHKNKLQNIDGEEDSIKERIEKIKKEIAILKEIKEYKNVENLEKQKLEISENKLNEYKLRIEELKNARKLDKKDIKKKFINPILLLCICIIVVGVSVVFKNNIISIILGIVSALVFTLNYYSYNKYKKAINMQNADEIKYKKELELLEESANGCKVEIGSGRQKIEEMQEHENACISNKYGASTQINQYVIEDIKEVEKQIENKQNEYNILALRENTTSIEKNNISSKLEDLVKQVERLEFLKEQKEDLNKLSKSITYAQEGIEEAYKIMKNSVTPKFTNELSQIVDKVTGGTYKNVRFNDEEGLVVEMENGEYINCSKLSIGTIDQMYLALRLAILSEISKENMPIILDEAFVYYDTERLENILKFISNEYSNKQVIMLTCTNRECEALSKLGIKYNLINL